MQDPGLLIQPNLTTPRQRESPLQLPGLWHTLKMFTLGCPNLNISVDHQPLLGILNDRDLSSIKNLRLLSLKEDILAWQFKITYNPGKWHKGPETVSRNPVGQEKL